jgi:hypothetical protein
LNEHSEGKIFLRKDSLQFISRDKKKNEKIDFYFHFFRQRRKEAMGNEEKKQIDNAITAKIALGY